MLCCRQERPRRAGDLFARSPLRVLGLVAALTLSLAAPLRAEDALLVCSTNTNAIQSGRPGQALKKESRAFLGSELVREQRGVIVKRLGSRQAIAIYLARGESSFSIFENDRGVLRERLVGLWETGYLPHSLADIDGDGAEELIVKRGGRLFVASFGPRGLELPQRGAPAIGTESYRDKSRFVDLDGDGCDDLLSLSIGDSRRKTELRWQRSLRKSFEAVQTLINPPDGLVDVIATDWDGDGDQDLFGLSGRDLGSQSGQVWYWEGTETTKFAEPQELFRFYPEDDRKQLHNFSEFSVADLNGDGKDELLVWIWRSDKAIQELRVLGRRLDERGDEKKLVEHPEFSSKGAELVLRGALLLPRKPREPGPPVDAVELEQIWERLGKDREGAALALSRALQADERLLAALEKKLRGRAPVRVEIGPSIQALASELREEREDAALRLSSMGEPIEGLLREALPRAEDPQARYLLWQLLDAIERQRSADSPLGLRRRRSVLLIEALGGEAAKAQLERLRGAALSPDIQTHLRQALARLSPPKDE